MDKITLIDKNIPRIKVFESYKAVSKPNPSFNAMMICYRFVYKRGSRVETIENARK
jgi:hypothetical protein